MVISSDPFRDVQGNPGHSRGKKTVQKESLTWPTRIDPSATAEAKTAGGTIHYMDESGQCRLHLTRIEEIECPEVDTQTRKAPGIAAAVNRRDDLVCAPCEQSFNHGHAHESGCSHYRNSPHCHTRGSACLYQFASIDCRFE